MVINLLVFIKSIKLICYLNLTDHVNCVGRTQGSAAGPKVQLRATLAPKFLPRKKFSTEGNSSSCF